MRRPCGPHSSACGAGPGSLSHGAGCPCHQETFHNLQPLFIKPATACLAGDGDGEKGASFPLALLPGPRPEANLPSSRSLDRVHLQSLPKLLPCQGFIMDQAPQFQAQLLFSQSCSLTSFSQTPHLCCCCHCWRCRSCRSIHPLRLPDTLLCLWRALFLAALRSPIL